MYIFIITNLQLSCLLVPFPLSLSDNFLFKVLGPLLTFGMGEARHFEFGVQINHSM